MDNNMKIWNALKSPPDSALKKITGGRLSGMTDIKPQWRYEAMTEHFGPCGTGWKFVIERLWIEDGDNGLKVANAEIKLYIQNENSIWSDPIPGIGGSMLVAKEKGGPYTSDEAYKMAVTDALSTAMKMIGVASDVYMGLSGDSKYSGRTQKQSDQKSGEMTKKQWAAIKAIGHKAHEMTEDEVKGMVVWKALKEGLKPRQWQITKFFIPEDKFQETFIEYSEAMLAKGSQGESAF